MDHLYFGHSTSSRRHPLGSAIKKATFKQKEKEKSGRQISIGKREQHQRDNCRRQKIRTKP